MEWVRCAVGRIGKEEGDTLQEGFCLDGGRVGQEALEGKSADGVRQLHTGSEASVRVCCEGEGGSACRPSRSRAKKEKLQRRSNG